jgi:hypothetical protein
MQFHVCDNSNGHDDDKLKLFTTHILLIFLSIKTTTKNNLISRNISFKVRIVFSQKLAVD